MITGAEANRSGAEAAQNTKRLTLSATQAGLSEPSSSTVLRSTTWMPPPASSAETTSLPHADA